MNAPSAVAVVIPSADGSRGGNVPRLVAQVRAALPDAEVEVVVGVRPNGRARNAGVAKTRAPMLVFLDDDIALGPGDPLGTLVATLAAHADVGLCGTAQQLPPDTRWWQRWAAREIPRSSSPIAPALADSDMVTTQCCAMRREVLDRVGGFHDALERGVDPDLRARVRRAGLRVAVAPAVCHYHPMPPSVGALIRMAFRDGAASARVQRRFPDLAIDTPDTYRPAVPGNVGLPRRIVRAAARLTFAALTLRLFRVLYFTCYACGYVRARCIPASPARQP